MIDLDRILGAVALAIFAAFNLIVVFYVKELDLTLVVLLGIGLAGYDFWRTLMPRRRS